MEHLKVFLSSTSQDLADYRAKVSEAVERLDQQSVRMEVFGARTGNATTESLQEVDDCDLFVGIYAHRYGYIPPGHSVSITSMEFDRATELQKPVFCFVIDPDYPWPPKHMEGEPGHSLLEAFKKKLDSTLVRDTFTTPEELGLKVVSALGRYLLRGRPDILDRFCRRAEGWWWSAGANPGAVGFLQLITDTGARTLIMSGRSYDLTGAPEAFWESAGSCVYAARCKLYYYWRGWWSVDAPGIPSHEGFGEVTFQDGGTRFESAEGVFYDSAISDLKSTSRKGSHYLRCSEAEVQTMAGSNKEAIAALVRTKILGP